MSSLWSPLVDTLTPYVPGEQPAQSGVIKLNTNENPYGPSPRVLDAIRAETSDELRLYPDPDARALKASAARCHDIAPDRVFVGNGSDEVLAHVFNGLLKHDAPILFPDITYSFYPVYCALYDIAYETVPLTDDFVIDPAAFARENGGIIFPNPNAPTGRALPRNSIEGLLERNRGSVVVIDEAYVAFGAESAIDFIERFDNLLVVQTLSKSHALAGLRVGLAFGHPLLIDALERIKNSFNSYPLDRLAIAGATAAIEDLEYLEVTLQKVIATRARLTEVLGELGFEVLPSAANFVFAAHRDRAARALARDLRDRSILVRHFDSGRIANYLRISIGTDEEIDALIAGLTQILT